MLQEHQFKKGPSSLLIFFTLLSGTNYTSTICLWTSSAISLFHLLFRREQQGIDVLLGYHTTVTLVYIFLHSSTNIHNNRASIGMCGNWHMLTCSSNTTTIMNNIKLYIILSISRSLLYTYVWNFFGSKVVNWILLHVCVLLSSSRFCLVLHYECA